jgi:hypothetical protein
MLKERHALLCSLQTLRSSMVVMGAGVLLYRVLQLLQCLFKLSYAPAACIYIHIQIIYIYIYVTCMYVCIYMCVCIQYI